MFFKMKGGQLTAAAHWIPDSHIAAMKAKRGDDKLWTTETYAFTFNLGEGAPGRAFQNNEPEFVADISALEASACPRKSLAAEFGVKSVHAVPCADGVIEVFSADGWAVAPNVQAIMAQGMDAHTEAAPIQQQMDAGNAAQLIGNATMAVALDPAGEGLLPITHGWDAKANRPKVIGHAPRAVRPSWMPDHGEGIAHVPALHWSMAVEQWVKLIGYCVSTDTWGALAKAKGEYNISMYDVKTHFVVPWTTGTGCSIALLLNSDPAPVELMVSHAWGGSVIETYNCMQNMVNHGNVPKTARIFFCTFSMYQPEDGAPGGLSIAEQLELKPFAAIIESKPKYGMHVIHTTTFEVYSRMWIVHEVDEGIEANVDMQGQFDMYRWTAHRFDAAMAVCTKESKCQPQDRVMLERLIVSRGGFARLDDQIKTFRLKMRSELVKLLTPAVVAKPVIGGGGAEDGGASITFMSTYCHFDWIREKNVESESYNMWESCTFPRCVARIDIRRRVSWTFDKDWEGAHPLGKDSHVLGAPGEYSRCSDIGFRLCCNKVLCPVLCIAGFGTCCLPCCCPASHHRFLACWPCGPEPLCCCIHSSARRQAIANCHNNCCYLRSPQEVSWA